MPAADHDLDLFADAEAPARQLSVPNAHLIEGNAQALALLERAATLAEACETLNEAYRLGEPLVSDAAYDQCFVLGLRQQDPDHPFLHRVEPEPLSLDLPTVRHATPMLSTSKAYDLEAVERYIQQVTRAAVEEGVAPDALRFRLTPKLDGIAGLDDGDRLVTRGDGLQGQDITRIIELGVVMQGGRGRGRGELVCDRAFFHAKLGKGTEYDQEHPRNFVAGFVSADSVKPHHRLALEAGAIRFVPFSDLPERIVTADELREGWETLYDTVVADNAYETDGMVVEVTDASLRHAMGATSSHERAVMAIKRQGESAVSTVLAVRLTTGRTGRIIPTLLIKPVVLSGATVSKATAHTAKNLLALGLGEGAQARFVRSGEVIPKLVEVLAPAKTPLAVTRCPSCGTEAVEEGEHMVCRNVSGCSAQAESRLRHWFHTLGNVDLFGRETVARLVAAGITELPAIYAMAADDFSALGFGPGQSANLVAQLERSRREPVMTWRWLAAFGIRHLGRGDARKLLQAIPLDDLGSVTAEQIAAIDGFGPKTSPEIAATLRDMWPLILHMRVLGFALEDETPATEAGADQPLAGQVICFTGTMVGASRKDMEAQAMAMGAQVQSAVNGKTTLLVAGDKAGSKVAKAEKLNDSGKGSIRILTEQDYRHAFAPQA
ncbi:BRCT domain-containing protein [Halomonas sp. C05BenzN]|uniref:BRCT domain-containing protein n=1 Tax=Halomonas sp. C05BenzN TaxID=3411041 RepID=UPI003B92810A